jgi:hypothetical protein
MSAGLSIEALYELLEGDREIVDHLEEIGFLTRRPTAGYSVDEVEHARVAHVLLRELEVNWAGVEVILRLRTELLVTRKTLSELLHVVRKPDGPAGRSR